MLSGAALERMHVGPVLAGNFDLVVNEIQLQRTACVGVYTEPSQTAAAVVAAAMNADAAPKWLADCSQHGGHRPHPSQVSSLNTPSCSS